VPSSCGGDSRNGRASDWRIWTAAAAGMAGRSAGAALKEREAEESESMISDKMKGRDL